MGFFFFCHFCSFIYLFKLPGSSKVVFPSTDEDEEGVLLNVFLCIFLGKKKKEKEKEGDLVTWFTISFFGHGTKLI